MKAFAAVVRLTCRHALRSHIFQLLLLVLMACVAFVPTTVGAGNAGEFIRVSLLYSLSGVTGILMLSAMWVSCYTMSHDIDNYQLHMVVCKPVSRVTLWLAKWCGVTLIHLLLLGIAAAAIYGIIIYRFESFQPEDFPASDRAAIKAEREKIRSEVMVGREVFLPDRPDYGKLARDRVKETARRAEERHLTLDLSPESQEKLFKEALKEIIAADSRVEAGQQPKLWVFSGLPQKLDRPVALRYRPYLGKVDSKDQRMTRVQWFLGIPQKPRDAGAQATDVFRKDKSRYDVMFLPLGTPEQLLSGVFHEKTLRPEWGFIAPDQKVFVAAVNLDPNKGLHYYQPNDGPKLLIPVCGFFANYCRAIIVAALAITMLSALSCAFGGFLTMPTAIFVVASYLLLGSFSLYLLDEEFYVNGTVDKAGQFLARCLLAVIVPLQEFEFSTQVAGGELISFSSIWNLVWFYGFCRVVPLMLMGIWFYRRRELGLVLRSK